MPSPFPGMDPYLEAQGVWPDFHATFLQAWREAISRALPGEYEAWIDERIQLVRPEEGPTKQLAADIGVTRRPGPASGFVAQPAGGAAVLEPIPHAVRYLDPPRESYVRILRRPDREVVAVVELLSPANKTGADFGNYILRRDELLREDVHLVELDLLTRGHRLPTVEPLPPEDYFAFVARAGRRPAIDVYAWSVRQPLPAMPIPLKAPDADVVIDLAAVFATAYDRGPYARSLDYGATPPSLLNEDDAAWAAEVARMARR